MDVRLPDGTIVKNVPEGTTKADLAAKLKANGMAVPDDWMSQTSGPSAAFEAGANYGGEGIGGMARSGARGLMSVLQGPTFGFADELAGAVGGAYKTATGPGSFSDNYKSTRDFWRGAADAEAKDDPFFGTTITRLMASAPTMLLGGAPTKAATLPMRTLQAAKFGGISGGVSGAGQSTAEDPLGVALDTAKSAATGAALSGLAQPVIAGMGSTYEAASGALSQSAAARYAKEKVAEAFARDARGAAVQANPSAPYSQAVARLNKLGPEARVVDAGGQNTRQLLDTIATLPGQTKDAVEGAIRTRQAGRADRLIGAAADGMRTGGQRAAGVIEDLIETRAQAATPLYGRLHQMEVQATGDLAQTLSAAEKLGAGKVARDIATAARVPYSLSAEEWAQSGGRLSMRDLDHMKQGVDTLIAKQTDPTGKVSPLGFQLQNLRARLLNQLDEATGGFYKTARDAFAGPSALIDATNLGKRFLSADDATTTRVLSRLSTSEQDAFRIGAFEALRNKAGRPGGQTELLGMWKDKILREKLQAIFPDERAFREFAATAAKEARMKGLEGVGRGSQTAARQYGAGDLDVAALADTAQALSGMNSPTGFLAGATNLWNRVKTPEKVRDEMGKALLSQGQAGKASVAQMEELLRRINEKRMREAAALGFGVGGQAAAPLGNLLMPAGQ